MELTDRQASKHRVARAGNNVTSKKERGVRLANAYGYVYAKLSRK